MTEAKPMQRLATGIPGLDLVLEGGLLAGGVYIVHGPPGAGKTILANQICFHRASQDDCAVYVTLLAESHARLVAHLRRMSFFDAKRVPRHVQYLSAFKPLEDQGLSGLLELLRRTLVSTKATLLVIDGIVSAEEVSMTWGISGESTRSSQAQDAAGANEFKKFIHELQTIATMTGCTALLLGSTERPRAFHPAYTMVDGILELTDHLHELLPVRHIDVRKIRGTAQRLGRHVYQITSDGIVVYPRIETLVPDEVAAEDDATRGGDPIAFGIEELDRMMRGGVPHRSMTMLVGPTGAGKTLMGLQYLAEGLRRGEPGVYFGFHERPNALLRKAERMGLDLKGAVERGALQIVWQPVSERLVDVLAHRLFTALRETKACRLFIDSMHGFYRALDDYPERIAGVLSAISDELQRLGVTTLYSVETQDIFGPTIEVPQPGISQATQNVVLLRYVELASRLHILLTIIKVRDTNHDRSVRELVVTDEGLRVQDFVGDARQMLAASSMYPTSATAAAGDADAERSSPGSEPKGRRTGRS